MPRLNSTPPSPSPDPHRGLLSWKGGTLLVVLGTSFLACSRGGSGSPAPEAAGAPLQITAQPQAATAGEGGTVTFTVAATGAEPLNFLWLKDDSPLVNAREASLTLTDIKAADAGSYRVHVISGRNRTLSDAATLVVQTLPVIETQPKGAALMEGEAASLSVGAAGLGLQYQWYKGEEAVPGAQGPVLEIKTARLEDAGSYRVEVSNLAGRVKSDAVALDVSRNPAFRPAIKSFTASATSILKDGKLTLAWDVAGATEISIEPGVLKGSTEAQGSVEVAPGGPMTYTLKASNGSGTISQECSVSVLDPVKISWLAAADPILPWGGKGSTLAWSLKGAPSWLTLDGAGLDPGAASAAVDLLQGRRTYTLAGGVLDQSDRAAAQVAVQGIHVVAGGGSGVGWKDGFRRDAGFFSPWSAAADQDGNLYVSDRGNHTIRKITPDGSVTTLAGKPGEAGSADGQGSTARFNQPEGIATFGDFVYVADSGNSTIRRIAKDGSEVLTFAGKAGEAGSLVGEGTVARFDHPQGLAVDSLGNLYVADPGASVVRKIKPDGEVLPLAGKDYQSDLVNDQGDLARFVSPSDLAVFDQDHIYVLDSTQTIRRIDRDANVTTEFDSGPLMVNVGGIAIQKAGKDGEAPSILYCSDTFHEQVMALDLKGKTMSPLAGKAGASGDEDGPGDSAQFQTPIGMACLPSGDLAVVDTGNNLIRKVILKPDAGPVVDTLAGAMNFQGYRNGKAQDAKFFYPSGVVQDKDGTIYVADTLNHVIRRISPSGLVDTLAGLGKDPGYRNGQGDGARFRNPVGLAMDASGLLYVGDLGNNLIRTVTKDGVVGTFAGQAGVGGMIDGPAHSATFEEPSYLAFGPSGDLYVSDPGNRAIRKVTPQGVVSTVDSNDGSKGMLYVAMTGLGVDAQGLLWVADGDSIRTIDADGKVETPASGFTFIADLAVLPGAAGVVVAGGVNGTIKQVSPSGKVEVVAGNPLVRGVDAGPLSNGLDVPMGIAVTPDGDLLVAVSGGVVQITAPAPAGAPAVTVVPQKGRVDDTAVFKAEARGRAPFTYVWQEVRPGKDPETLVGENKAYLAHRVGAGDDGTAYQVTVTDGDKISVTSSPARLTVLP